MATAQTTPATAAKTRRASAPKRTPRAKATAKRTTASAGASASTKRSTQAVKNDTLGSYAERAVLIPVGAALIARERVVASVSHTIDHYATPSKASAQLRKFERRGNTARSRVEREIRKTRVRVEREVRQTRGRVEREVTRRKRDGEELANRVQERILSLV
ncbi:MAG TPA: hypothetical protein VIG42_08865 [Solirubrobacteraceae bacterium]|jgi:hypothetical protein